MTAVRDALKFEGVEKVTEENAVEKFKNNIVATGHLPEKSVRKLKDIMQAKSAFEKGKMTKAEVNKITRSSGSFIRSITDFIQEKRGKQLEKAKVRVKHGEKIAEITLLGKKAFIIDNIDAKEKQLESAPIKEDGSLGTAKTCSIEDFEKALAKEKIPERVFIKQPVFDNIKKRYGEDSEILIKF